MLYICCPTCHRILSDKMIPYEEGLKKIVDDPNLTNEQKDEAKMKLIDSLKVPQSRYCCKMRILSFRNLVEIVK